VYHLECPCRLTRHICIEFSLYNLLRLNLAWTSIFLYATEPSDTLSTVKQEWLFQASLECRIFIGILKDFCTWVIFIGLQFSISSTYEFGSLYCVTRHAIEELCDPIIFLPRHRLLPSLRPHPSPPHAAGPPPLPTRVRSSARPIVQKSFRMNFLSQLGSP
jgi:hypothetical protein